MKVFFSENALKDISFFNTNEPEIIDKIKKLIANIKEMPYKGLGKPEPWYLFCSFVGEIFVSLKHS